MSDFDLKAFSDAVARLVTRAAPGVVTVQSHRSHASGFVWRPGLIVTADETLADEGEVAVIFAGEEPVNATLAGRDHTTDIALLRVSDSARQPASLSTAAVTAGSLAVTVGRIEGGDAAGVASIPVIKLIDAVRERSNEAAGILEPTEHCGGSAACRHCPKAPPDGGFCRICDARGGRRNTSSVSQGHGRPRLC